MLQPLVIDAKSSTELQVKRMVGLRQKKMRSSDDTFLLELCVAADGSGGPSSGYHANYRVSLRVTVRHHPCEPASLMIPMGSQQAGGSSAEVPDMLLENVSVGVGALLSRKGVSGTTMARDLSRPMDFFCAVLTRVIAVRCELDIEIGEGTASDQVLFTLRLKEGSAWMYKGWVRRAHVNGFFTFPPAKEVAKAVTTTSVATKKTSKKGKKSVPVSPAPEASPTKH